ncbi:MAG: corrinoid protein [Anaerolineae bacterium]|nr:corrinoid protein [Anaerolineae bacterium]
MRQERLLDQLYALFTASPGEASYDQVVELTERLLAEGVHALDVIDTASRAMHRVGERFAAFEIFLPELMIAGERMKRCMAVLQPPLLAGGAQAACGRVVIGTVSGDVHDIGKNLVATMLSVGGFDVVDLGVNVPPLDFIRAAREQRADILALSSLMTASLPYQKEVIDLLVELGERDRYYVIIGGGPVTPSFAVQAGADGWTDNAAKAVGLCKQLMESKQRPPLKTLVI